MPNLKLLAFWHDESASAALEFIVLAGTISVVCLAVGAEYRDRVNGMLIDISRQLSRVNF